jgi:hypothetical protein
LLAIFRQRSDILALSAEEIFWVQAPAPSEHTLFQDWQIAHVSVCLDVHGLGRLKNNSLPSLSVCARLTQQHFIPHLGAGKYLSHSVLVTAW